MMWGVQPPEAESNHPVKIQTYSTTAVRLSASIEMYTSQAAAIPTELLPINRSTWNLLRCNNVQKDLTTPTRARPYRPFTQHCLPAGERGTLPKACVIGSEGCGLGRIGHRGMDQQANRK